MIPDVGISYRVAQNKQTPGFSLSLQYNNGLQVSQMLQKALSNAAATTEPAHTTPEPPDRRENGGKRALKGS